MSYTADFTSFADAEAIAAAILAAAPPVTAYTTRIGTELDLTDPASLPALRVTAIGGTAPVPHRLDGVSLQLEAWASSRLTARDLLYTARAVLLSRDIVGVYPYGVVTGSADGQLPRPLPDPATDLPRWLCTVTVFVHPLPQ